MTVLSSPTVLIVLVSILFLSLPATSRKDVDYTYKYGTFLNDMYDVVAENDNTYVQYLGCAWANSQGYESEQCMEKSSDRGDEGYWVQMSFCYNVQLIYGLYEDSSCKDSIADFVTNADGVNVPYVLQNVLFTEDWSQVYQDLLAFSSQGNDGDNGNRRRLSSNNGQGNPGCIDPNETYDDSYDDDGAYRNKYERQKNEAITEGTYYGLGCVDNDIIIAQYSDSSCQTYVDKVDELSSLNKLLRRQTCERCDNGDNRNREASNYYYGSDDDGDDAGDDAGDDGNYDYSNWPAKNDCLTAMTMSLVCSKSDYALCKKTKLEKLGETRFHNLLSTVTKVTWFAAITVAAFALGLILMDPAKKAWKKRSNLNFEMLNFSRERRGGNRSSRRSTSRSRSKSKRKSKSKEPKEPDFTSWSSTGTVISHAITDVLATERNPDLQGSNLEMGGRESKSKRKKPKEKKKSKKKSVRTVEM